MSRNIYLMCSALVVGLLLGHVIQADEAVPPATTPPTIAEQSGADDSVEDPARPGVEATAAIKAMLEEQTKAASALQKVREAAPYQQTSTIGTGAAGEHILGFCVLSNGQLVAISGQREGYGEASIGGAVANLFARPGKSISHRVHWFDADGKSLRSLEVPFKSKAINVGPRDSVFVVGEGKIAQFDKEGKQLVQADSPHMVDAIADREQFESDVMDRHNEDIATTQEQIDQFTAALKELDAKPADQQSKTERQQAQNMRSIATAYEKMLKTKKDAKREVVIEQAIARLKELHRVAATEKDVFIVTNEATGYGFCVWRMDHNLKGAKRIVSKLSGCCGQMDIQIAGDGLAIAENSRHRVVLVDRDGKTKKSFGQSSRSDVKVGFGGCCNPMNTCVDAQGCLLTSESNGLVKRFNLAGEFQDIVGVAKVTEGCKNSSIGIAPQGEQLYYFDVTKGQILVLKKST